MDATLLNILKQTLDPLDSLEMLAEADPAYENKIFYMNSKAIKVMEHHHAQLGAQLRGADVRTALNHSIHQFHKDPERIRNILRGLAAGQMDNHATNLTVGGVSFQLSFSAIRDETGEVLAFHASWHDRTAALKIGEILSRTITLTVETSEEMDQAKEGVRSGAQQAGSAMQALTQQIRSNRDGVEELKGKVLAIGRIAQNIREIAYQTNLLALNAAIEAARAGEHGRGFAVVADEVRNLSRRVQEATEEVQGNITDIDAATQKIDQSSQQAIQGAEKAQSALDVSEAEANKLESLSIAMSVKSAISSHEIFVANIELEMTAAERSRHAADLPDHHQCAFGQWYDTAGERAMGKLREFQEIAAPHAAAHAAGKAALNALDRGDRAEAARQIALLQSSRDAVVTALQALLGKARDGLGGQQ